MKLAHLIMAHNDIEHIIRLTNLLSRFSDVFVHIDINTDAELLFKTFENTSNVHFVRKRYRCFWGGYNAVEAEIELVRIAIETDSYDRLVFLQGADYPIKSAEYIINFFENNKNVEFIRGCCCTDSKDPYFSYRVHTYIFKNNPNLIKKIYNKLIYELHRKGIIIKMRDGYIHDGKDYKVYWGAAQWALTGHCAKYIVDFHDSHPKFNIWFKYSFPCDEMYFQTVLFNSPWSRKTSQGGPEEPFPGLVNWRNLHYFEYNKIIRIYNSEDFEFICNRDELYIRKVNTTESTELLNMLDHINSFS